MTRTVKSLGTESILPVVNLIFRFDYSLSYGRNLCDNCSGLIY